MAKICWGSVQTLTACIPEGQACSCTHLPLPHGHDIEKTPHWEPAHVLILSVMAMPMVVQIGQVWMHTTMAPAAPTPFPMSRYRFYVYRQVSLSVGYGQLLLACCMPTPCCWPAACLLPVVGLLHAHPLSARMDLCACVCTHHGNTDERCVPCCVTRHKSCTWSITRNAAHGAVSCNFSCIAAPVQLSVVGLESPLASSLVTDV